LRHLTILPLLLVCFSSIAQKNDIGWIAPEGKIINNRTLTWDDFQNREDKEFAKNLAAQGYRARAYVIPAIYFKWIDGKRQDNGRIKFKAVAKCAFQSHAYVRDDVKNSHSNYVRTHEQDHYDIALVFARKMEEAVVSKDYSEKNYDAEIDKILEDYYKQYHELQEKYDHEVNPEGKDDVPMQELWDMRIKKCLENNTLEYFNSPLSVVENVKTWGQTVKRLPDEDLKRFCTRARPLYTDFLDENAAISFETNEWTEQNCVVAFYSQKYFVEEEGKPVQDCSRMLGYIFIPNGKDTYRRSFIDTFCIDDKEPKINAVFFANADSDQTKELIIQTTIVKRDKNASGTQYETKVYDNIKPRSVPPKLKKVIATADFGDGFEGTLNGKPQKAPYKGEKELTEALTKLGFANQASPGSTSPPQRKIHR
jgi:hypothetical protein